MMLTEENIVTLMNAKTNEILKMKRLKITQHISNSVIKTEVQQIFDYEESVHVLFKHHQNRKKIKISLGEKILKSKLEEHNPLNDNEEYFYTKDRRFQKYNDYKIIKNMKVPKIEEIVIEFIEIGCVLAKQSCLYFNIIRCFSNQVVEDLEKYSLYVYLATSSEIDFIKIQSKAQTKVTFHNNKKNVSISQVDIKKMEDFTMFYRHKNIHIPQIIYGKVNQCQTVLMLDYLPPFNPEKDFKQCLKEDLRSLEKDQDQLNSLESVEFCIVIDTCIVDPNQKFQVISMNHLIHQVLQKIQNLIIQNQISDTDTTKQQPSHYISVSYMDESGWQREEFKLKENALDTHSYIKNVVIPKIQWKKEQSDLANFMNNFSIVQNILKIRKVLFLVTQAQWDNFENSVLQLKQFRQCILENKPYPPNDQNDFIETSIKKFTKIEIEEEPEASPSMKNETDILNKNNNSIKSENSDKNESKEEKQNSNSNILDVFIVFHGIEEYARNKLSQAVNVDGISKRFFTKDTIDSSFPQQDLMYLKKHSDFYLDITEGDIEFSTIQQLKNLQKSSSYNINIQYNQIFQQFVFLELGTSVLNGSLRYFDGRTRKHVSVPLEFCSKKDKKRSRQDNNQPIDFVRSDDIVLAGLIKTFKTEEFYDKIEVMKEFSIRNHIFSEVTRQAFNLYDKEVNSDSSIQEITSLVQQTTSTQINSLASKHPYIVRYEQPKGDLTNPELAKQGNFDKTEGKDFIQKLISKSHQDREQKRNENIINFKKIFATKQHQIVQNVKTIISSQQKNGHWNKSEALMNILKINEKDFCQLKRKLSYRSVAHIESLIITSFTLITLKLKYNEYHKFWETSQVRATSWIDENFDQDAYTKTFKLTRELYDIKNPLD